MTRQWYGCQCLGFLTCSQTLIRAIAHVGCTDIEFALEADSGRTTPCRFEESSPRQYCLAFQSDALPTELSRPVALSQLSPSYPKFSLLIQFGSVRSEKKQANKPNTKCAPPCLSEVSPKLPLKQFQCSSDWFVQRFLFLRISPPGDRWCDVLGFAPQVVLKLLNTSRLPRSKRLVMVALPASVSAC